MKDEVKIKSIDLLGLYPDRQTGRPVTAKLRILLRQVGLGIDNQDVVAGNSYLDRLMTECRLFLPEMFDSKWNKIWDFTLAKLIEGTLISSNLDLMISPKRELVIVDWSGLAAEENFVTLVGACLLYEQLSLKLSLNLTNVSIVTLASTELISNLRIKFDRRALRDEDLIVCRQDLVRRLESLDRGVDLHQLVLESEPNLDPLLDLEGIPEITI